MLAPCQQATNRFYVGPASNKNNQKQQLMYLQKGKNKTDTKNTQTIKASYSFNKRIALGRRVL